MKTSFLFLIILLLFGACDHPKEHAISESMSISAAGETADFPQIVQDTKGNLIALWVEEDPESGENMVMFSRSNKDDLAFQESHTIEVTKGINAGSEHLPKLIIKPDSTYVLVYARKNSGAESHFASSVLYTQSFDQGKTWTDSELIHSDTNPENSHGFPDAILLPDGEVAAVWLDGRHHLKHSTIYFAKTNGRDGFGEDKRIGGASCQCCKLDLFVDEKENLHLVYRSLTENNIRDIAHIVSDDLGITFSNPVTVSDDHWKLMACPHNGPSITETKDGLFTLWFTAGGEEGLYYARSEGENENFSDRIKLSDQAKQPYIASLGSSALAIWNEIYEGGEENYQRINICYIDSKGASEKQFLSPEGIDASMPSFLKTDDGEIIITWRQSSETGNELRFAVIGGQ